MPKSIAFFGATGGCTLNCLIPALQAGYRCSVLVRSPDKLHALLHQHDVTVPTANLAVIQGSIDDADAVRRTLIVRSASATLSEPGSAQNGSGSLEGSDGGEGQLVDFIISGVGGTPRFDNPLRPTLDNPTICQDAVRNVLDACRALQSQSQNQRTRTRAGEGDGDGDGDGAGSGSTVGAGANLPATQGHGQSKKPYLIVISTTGIASKRDIPIAMIPLYHWVLRVPHEDKRVMEEVIRAEMLKDKCVLSGYTIIRPSLLTSGEGVGTGKIRFGVDDDAAVGYTISRRDVGRWMFERVLEGDGAEFAGRVVSLTV